MGAPAPLDVVDLLLVGHLSRDVNVQGGIEERSWGGGVRYGAYAPLVLDRSVMIATRVGQDGEGIIRAMARDGIHVHAVHTPESTAIRNVYHTADRERRDCHRIASAGAFELSDIPAIDARVIHCVGLVRGEIPDDLVLALADRAPVGVDAQGFVRVAGEDGRMGFEDWPGKDRVLARVTYLKVDHAEAEILTGETDLDRCLAALAAMGPEEILLTHPGGVAVLAQGTRHDAPWTNETNDGRTGRGDTCTASYLAARASMGPLDAVRWAAAVTSLKMERPGPFRGRRSTVESRMLT